MNIEIDVGSLFVFVFNFFYCWEDRFGLGCAENLEMNMFEDCERLHLVFV